MLFRTTLERIPNGYPRSPFDFTLRFSAPLEGCWPHINQESALIHCLILIDGFDTVNPKLCDLHLPICGKRLLIVLQG